MSEVDQTNYGCGNTPMTGDLIEFGSRKKRFVITSVNDEANEFKAESGSWMFGAEMLRLSTLVARHGQPETPK